MFVLIAKKPIVVQFVDGTESLRNVRIMKNKRSITLVRCD